MIWYDSFLWHDGVNLFLYEGHYFETLVWNTHSSLLHGYLEYIGDIKIVWTWSKVRGNERSCINKNLKKWWKY